MAEPTRPGLVTLGSLLGGKGGNDVPPAPVHQDALVKDPLPPVAESNSREAKLWWYHLGTLPGCPHQTVHVSAKGDGFKIAAAFTKAAETVLLDRGTGTTSRSLRRGDFIQLTEAEAKALVERVKQKVVRWTSRKDSRGFILDMTDKRYQRSANDEPLGRFLFLKRISEDAARALLDPIGADGDVAPMDVPKDFKVEPEVAVSAQRGRKEQ
jgi:hypothetical protein